MIKNKKYYIGLVVLFTTKIYKLSNHLKNNNKDYKTLLALTKAVSIRKKILNYIKKNDNKLFLNIKKNIKH